MKVSIIVPCFNAIGKIGRCLASLRDVDMPAQDYEVIFIDDCSTDETFTLLEQECEKEPNWHIQQLAKNSGSPSRPRNRGLSLAKGEYVLFLDCDDEIIKDTIKIQYDYAAKNNSDIVRAYMIVDDGRSRRKANKIANWNNSLERKARLAVILCEQSLTKTCLIKRSLLKNNKILFPEDMKMGEDVVFVAEALCSATNIDYLEHPTYIYHIARTPIASTTHSFGAKELSDQLKMWPRLEKIYRSADIDYVTARLHINLRYVLSLLIYKKRPDIDENIFYSLTSYLKTRIHDIKKEDYSGRYLEIIEAIRSENFEQFSNLTRPRLLIAGYDLKFISPAIPELSKYFEVRIDEWPGHNDHDEEKSKELLNWAELIWCEWLLGNSVWYSRNKKPHQRLIIRMHRFELSRDFGEKIEIEKVDAITAVSVHFFERLLERYQNIPRAKARLLPNFVSVDDYEQAKFSEQQLFTLGVIGILPARKRFDRALRILAKLREKDPRYCLEVFGKQPEELHWIATDKNEVSYFTECQNFIKEKNLETAITFHGHTDIKKTLAQNNVGFVLSTSESMRELPGFESFHLAVADAFAAGGIGLVLHWHGAEYIWPKEFIFQTEDSIVEKILRLQKNPQDFISYSNYGKEFIKSQYDEKQFTDSVRNIYMEFF